MISKNPRNPDQLTDRGFVFISLRRQHQTPLHHPNRYGCVNGQSRVQYYGANLNYERRFLYADHQGNIIAHSKYMGTLSNALTYDAYGIPGSANLDRFGYTGQIWFKELGLSHYKARMYHPKLGRFLQTDPIFYADQMNMYAYVGNDPVNMIDPTGLESVCANSRADACYSGPADFGASNSANKSESSQTPNNSGNYNFRKTDANPEEYNEADLINDGINSIVNSPDGIVRVRSDPNNPDSGYNIRKEGNTVSRDNLKATYEVISSNKVKINVLEGGAGVKSLTITSSQAGKIEIEGVPFRYRIFVKKTYE